MKFITIAISIFIPISLFAQKKLSIELNTGAAIYSNTFNQLKKMPLLTNEQGSAASSISGISVSLLLGYKINKRLGLQAGVGYQTRNFTYTHPPPFTRVLVGGSNKGSIEFLMLPIRGQYDVFQKGAVRLFTTAGITTRFSFVDDKQLFGTSTKIPPGLGNIQSSHNVFLNGQNNVAVFNGDSSVLLMANYYQINKVDFFANAGAGASYQINKRLAVQLIAEYNFQLSQNNFFGKYRYEELYRNGTFVGVFEESKNSNRFRENFFTIQAGLVYFLH